MTLVVAVAVVVDIPALNVLAPVNVCVPVVTTPEIEAEAEGIALKETALVPLTVKLPVGPEEVPFVQANFVG